MAQDLVDEVSTPSPGEYNRFHNVAAIIKSDGTDAAYRCELSILLYGLCCWNGRQRCMMMMIVMNALIEAQTDA